MLPNQRCRWRSSSWHAAAEALLRYSFKPSHALDFRVYDLGARSFIPAATLHARGVSNKKISPCPPPRKLGGQVGVRGLPAWLLTLLESLAQFSRMSRSRSVSSACSIKFRARRNPVGSKRWGGSRASRSSVGV